MSITVIMTLLVSVLSCTSMKPDNAQATKSLDGRWRLEAVEEDGKPVELGDHQPRWVIKGNTLQYAGEKLAELKLDENSSPKCIDLHWVKPVRSYEGIYSLDGDVVKLCVNRDTEGAKVRPHDFATEGKSNLRVLTFRRETTENNNPLEGVAGFVGIMIGLSDDKQQIVIVSTFKDSPAEKAGLLKEDVVGAVNGSSITELQPLVAVIRKQKPGQEIMLKIKRNGQEKELKITVGKLPFLYLD